MTEYGKEIKKRLVDLEQPQTWLIGEVKKETGLYFDSPYLARIISGKNKNAKVMAAINKILGI